MSATPSPLEFREEAGLDPAATGDPFVRVRYRYGMLLGADDLTLEQRSHLLRHRVHQALLHGAGTVWGLGVRPHLGTDGRRELKVGSGLAIDALGREVFVPGDLCLDLSGVLYKLEWSKLESVPDGAARRVYVVLRHERAESQPVPAIRPPGASDADAVAYSRVEDRYRVDLQAACPADPGAALMGWLGRGDLDLEGRSIASLRDALVAWITGPAGKLDALWTVEEEAPLVLASVDLVRDDPNDDRSAVTVSRVDNAVRALCPSLPLLHEQLLGQRLSGVDGGVGCRVRAIDVSRASGALGVDVRLTAALDGRTKDGARLLALGPAGWSRVSASVAAAADSLSLRISPEVALAEGSRVQVLIPGQGEGPVLGVDGQPLGGWWDDPLPAAGRGLDVSWVGLWAEVVS